MEDEENERPVWKTVLSILFTLFIVVKLIYTLSKSNDHKSSYPDYSMNNTSTSVQEMLQKQQAIYKENNKKLSNDILYKDYEFLEKVDQTTLNNYDVIKLKTDSLVNIDFSAKLKLNKNWYFQNNHDQYMKMAIKTTDNLNVFIHDFDSNERLEDSFEALKKNGMINGIKVSKNPKSNNISITYSITKNNNKFNGYALAVEENHHHLFIEFESQNLSKEKLKTKGIFFIALNLKTKLKSQSKN